jgi:hypothetical protein
VEAFEHPHDTPPYPFIPSPTFAHTSTPDPGDLVIVLPDDNQSLADITPYRVQGELLFSYEPGIPQWLYPFIRSLPIADVTRLRDGWLHASVTAWK